MQVKSVHTPKMDFILLLLVVLFLPALVDCGEKLALLSATLRTYQRAACDTAQVSLSCPRGTSISIELAQYGRPDGKDGITIEDMCPSDGQSNSSSNSRSDPNSTLPGQSAPTGTSGNSTGQRSSNGNEVTSPENCMWPNALQYSLLQTVVEACQKKKHCKFNAFPGTYRGGGTSSGVGESSGTSSFYGSSSTTSISADPCPRVRKLVEIAYKCRPYKSVTTKKLGRASADAPDPSSLTTTELVNVGTYDAPLGGTKTPKKIELRFADEFRSKVACENDVIQLECNPYSRIAVYSASFGRTEYESIQCPQPQGVKEETCLASYATETVMQICHGRRRCNLSADSSTFGSPCQPNSRMYLKVVYTCVPKQVLKDRYESESEPDEPEHFDGDTSDLYDEDQFYKESEAIPKLQSNLTRSTSDADGASTAEPSTSSNPVMTLSKDSSLEEDYNRLYLYLLIAGTVGVLLCIALVIVRVVIQKRRNQAENQTSSPKGETTIPNGFNDSISEIDADIDLTTPVPVPSVSKNENYIACGPSASLYGSLGPSNVSHTSSTMLLATNSMMCARQSPDIIGVSNTFVGQPPHVSSSIGTIVPISSLAQYTTAPTFHTGYIMDPDGILRRPPGAPQPVGGGGVLHPPPPQQPQPQETFQYDGTAPRTLSTGVAHNSQFYYG